MGQPFASRVMFFTGDLYQFDLVEDLSLHKKPR